MMLIILINMLFINKICKQKWKPKHCLFVTYQVKAYLSLYHVFILFFFFNLWQPRSYMIQHSLSPKG